MANYIIDSNGNWSKKEKNKKGTDYTIDAQGNWTPIEYKNQTVQPTVKVTSKEDKSSKNSKTSKNKQNTEDTINNVISSSPFLIPVNVARKELFDKEYQKKNFGEKLQDNINDAKNALDVNKMVYRAKNLGTGALAAGTGVVETPFQDLQNDMQKGAQRDQNWYNQNALKTIGGMLISPSLLYPVKQIQKELFDEEYKKKNVIEKTLDNFNDIVESLEPAGLKEAARTFGTFDKQILGGKAEKGVGDLRKTINKPLNSAKEDLEKEAEKYDPYTQFAGNVWQQVGIMAPSIAASVITKDPDIGLGVMGAGVRGMTVNEEEAEGKTLDQAIQIGNMKAALEILTEKMYSGIKIGGKSAFGTGALDETVEKLVNSKVTNPLLNFLTKQGVSVVGEIGEELVSDVAGILIDFGTDTPKEEQTLENLFNRYYEYFFKGGLSETVAQTAASTILLNLLGGGMGPKAYKANTQNIINQNLTQKALNQQAQQNVAKNKGDVLSNIRGNQDVTNVYNQQSQVIDNAIQKGSETLNLGENKVQENAKKPRLVDKINDKLWELQGKPDNYIGLADAQNMKESISQPIIEGQQEQSKYINKVMEDLKTNNKTSDNAKIQKFRDSVVKENIQDADGFYKAVEKIIQDKDYNVVLDSNIKNQNGQSVDALISNEDGITIKINPKSARAGEILLMHEVTHGIQTNEINKMITDYASKNAEFNNALEDLKRSYGVEDITPEVAADISGQLFGNQEFINDLSVENPSLFKRIYNAIVSIANKLTGNSKESLFVKDLKAKWEKAYRESTIQSAQQNLNNEVKYSQNNKNNVVVKDNQGRTLSKDQQKFYKDISPEMLDENGNLITVYHTMTDYGVPFYIFNPVGTPGYRFGNDVVIYATDSEFMSGSYAKQNYIKADTHRYTNVGEIQEFLNKFNEIYPSENPWYIEKTTSKDYYDNYLSKEDKLNPKKVSKAKPNVEYIINRRSNGLNEAITFSSENDLFRNWKNRFSDAINDADDIPGSGHNKGKYMYEGYMNLTNPYVVDAEGGYWNEVAQIVSKEKMQVIDEMKNHKEELYDLVKESDRKSEEWGRKYATKTNLTSELITHTKSDAFNDIVKTRLIYSVDDYNKFYQKGLEEGYDFPSPDSKLGDNLSESKKSWIKSMYRFENVDEILNTKMSDVFENYKSLEEKRLEEAVPSFWFKNHYDKILGKKVNYEALDSFFDAYSIANSDYSDESIKRLAGTSMSTNDVVHYIIAENKTLLENQKYDGIIFKNVVDYGQMIDDMEPHNVYAAFDPSQFKAVDNLHPTSDPDIRYAENAKKWREFVEKNFPNDGTKTILKDKIGKKKTITAKSNNGQEITLKQDSKNSNVYNQEVIDNDLKDITNSYKNKTVTKGDLSVSNFYSNITEKSKFIDMSIREFFKTENDLKFYKTVSNEESLTEAAKRLGKTVQQQQKAFDDFLTKTEQFDSIDMAEGWILLERFNEAADYDNAYLVAKKMKEMGTKAGQAIQILNLESRLTPEGMYRWAVSELMEAETKFNKQKGRKKSDIVKYKDSFRLTVEETEFIKNQMEKIQKMPDGREKNIELAKINSMLQDKLPHQKGQSLKAWMRMSMLLNPKTQVRNIVGNAGIVPINSVADVFGSMVDKAISKKTGVRTLGAPSLGGLVEYGKGFARGIAEATEDYKLGIDTKNINQNRFDIGQGKAFNENHSGPLKGVRNSFAKKLNAMNDFLSYVMDAGDRGFYKGSMEQSLYNQMKLNNANQATNTMIEIAENEGLQRTWNDSNEYTRAVLNLRRSINDIGNQIHLHVGEYGLGDLLIPFAKTPANLTKAIVDYSPVGFLNAITEGKNLKRAIETGNYTPQMQHDFAQNIGKATAGTLLYAIGVALAKAGITTGNSDDDKDLKKFMKETLGIQPYSIKVKINGKQYSFTYDWAQPVAAPLAITADIEKGMQENMTPTQAIQHFLTTGFNILSQQSFLTGVNEVLNNNDGILEGIEQQVVNIPATAIPTFVKQIADMFDTTKRQTYTKEGQVENMKKTAKSKLPGVSKSLSKQIDVLGNEVEKYGGHGFLYPFKVFLSPSNITSEKEDEVAKEIYALYEATGDKTIIPRKVDYSTKINGENKILTAKEIEKWQTASGKLVTQEVKKAMNNSTYKSMSNEEKAAVINKIVNYSYNKAKSETFDTPLANTYNGAEKAKNKGMGIADYYISVVYKNSKK